MQSIRSTALIALLVCLPAIGACSSGQSSSGGLVGSINSSISSAMDKAETQLHTQPITVSHGDSNLPVAKITPEGDFIVGGKTIAITPTQRNALLAYRKQLVSIASQGIAIGKRGAKLGLSAASAAIAGVFTGESDQAIQQKVKARTAGIRKAAAKICNRLPSLMAEQQKLAAVLPAFKPYATMTQQDIDDCRTDALNDND